MTFKMRFCIFFKWVPIFLLWQVTGSGSIRTRTSNFKNASMASLNGTELLLKCPPAEELVRTHMAPDFEYPQLVRRLDWFHDELLVASYQQVSLGENCLF